MNTKLIRVAFLLTALLALANEAHAQTTSFTYQGRLTESDTPAKGIYDLRFTVYGAAIGGSAVTAPLDRNDTPVTNGLFTVTLDFTAAPFDGSPRWLQIAVRPGASTGTYTTLAPRQPITAAPYAIRALSAGSASTATTASTVSVGAVNNLALANNAVDGSKILNGSISSPDLEDSLLNHTFWKLTGNAGTMEGVHFLGTADNQPLELKVYNQRALRLEPAGGNPNVIGGYSGNVVTAGFSGATISGGGGSGSENRINADFATVSGGSLNTSTGRHSTVGGGERNTTGGPSSTVSGGYQNISAGEGATVPGGSFNTAGGSFSFAAGYHARADHSGAFVWADPTDWDFSSSGINQFLIRATGGVGINTTHPNGAALAVNGFVAAFSDATEGFKVSGAAAGYELQDRYLEGVPGRWVMFAADGVLGFHGAGFTRMSVDSAGVVSALAFNPTSDRNAKESFQPVSPRAVLDKVASLPLSEWNFKEDAASRHIGPMAQDFRAAFGLGSDDKHIATVDADGVALAAIQGLNQKVENSSQAFEERLHQKETEITELRQRLEKLERLMNRQDGGAR